MPRPHHAEAHARRTHAANQYGHQHAHTLRKMKEPNLDVMDSVIRCSYVLMSLDSTFWCTFSSWECRHSKSEHGTTSLASSKIYTKYKVQTEQILPTAELDQSHQHSSDDEESIGLGPICPVVWIRHRINNNLLLLSIVVVSFRSIISMGLDICLVFQQILS